MFTSVTVRVILPVFAQSRRRTSRASSSSSSIHMRDEISKVGILDWDKELMHWVRRKLRGMAEIRVGIRVLVEDQKH